MAERPKLLYIIVQDHVPNSAEKGKIHSLSFRYTRSVLQSTLQFIGCKARHAFKISRRVFDILTENSLKSQDNNGSATSELPKHDYSRHLSDSEIDSTRDFSPEDIKKAAEKTDIKLKEITKKLYDFQKKRSTIVLSRDEFMDVVCDAMSEYRYFGPNQRNDFALACKIREKKMSVTVLLCGTSGCGKSTLSTLLASRLGITTVVSTDSIRHMMRSFADEKQNPLLWASTYSAGEHLDPKAVAEAKAKKKAKKMARKYSSQENQQLPRIPLQENIVVQQGNAQTLRSEVDVKGKAPILANDGNHVLGSAEVTVSSKTMAIEGYKAQSEMVIDSLDRLITSWEQKCESVIVEGVHLSLDFVMGLMKKHPSIIPFMIYIANEEKHMERFAVRAKYMTLDPAKNKYVKYIRNIRAIQDYQCKRADKYLIPKVNNTNMDQSVASIHATIFACMRRRQGGEPFHDDAGNTVKMVDDEYKNQCAAHTLGSKGMLQIIRRRGSSRQLMALMNTDGSVAKAWAFETSDAGRKLPIPYEEDATSSKNDEENNSASMYNDEGLEVTPVNLQFGNFGLSAWPNDMGGTSYSGSMDGVCSSKGDAFDNQSSHRSSRYGSSCSSSPRLNEGTEKELVFDESAASGSDEEQEEEVVDLDSEEELNNERDQQLEEEVEGSVADQSGSEEEDEYNGGDNQEENEIINGAVDSLVRTRSTYGFSLENGYEVSKVFKEQDMNCGIQQGSLLISDFKGSESYVKHLHGRSKSLPLTASYGSY